MSNILEMNNLLRIAIVGTRGIPANYGGFETFAQELSVRLVARGHQVSVYCRSHYFRHPQRRFGGVELRVLPSVRHKYLDTVVHSLIALADAACRSFDVVLVCNAVNAAFCLLPRLTGKRVVLNVDGLEWQRRKWNFLGRAYYRLSEKIACFAPNVVVTDAATVQNYYRRCHRKETEMIPYGAGDFQTPPGPTLAGLGLQGGDYYLYVSRLEPENNAHLVIQIFERLRTHRRLLIVGDAPYNRRYIQSLKSTTDPRITFTGSIYGEGYQELVANAFCYIHATEVGGTHPALVENLAAGNLVFFLATPENSEVAGEGGIPFPGDDMDAALQLLQAVEDNPDGFTQLKQQARQIARERYSWDKVVQDYEALFQRLVPKG